MNPPEASILSFPHKCDSGVKGANPRVRHSTIRIDRGIRLNKLRMVDISVEIGGFISPNYLHKTIVSLKEHNMKTKTYPEIGFLHLRDVIGGKDNPGIIPVSRSSRYKGIAEGRYPKPVKLGDRMVAWRVEDIRRLIDELVSRNRKKNPKKKLQTKNPKKKLQTKSPRKKPLSQNPKKEPPSLKKNPVNPE